jgi:acetylglutamate kinase
LACLEAGVRKTHIIDGRLRHSLLLEIFTESGVGTEIEPEQHPDRLSPQGRRPVLVR